MKRILAVVAVLTAGVVAAFGQAFPNYPTLNIPADTQCIAYGNAGRCTQYRPAGPTALTGNETVPADTNVTDGSQLQTIRVPVRNLNAGKTTFNTPVTTDNITIDPQTRQLIVTPAYRS